MFIDPYQIQHAIRNGISIPGGGDVQFSAGSLSGLRSDLTFSNSNGVSFGLNTNGVITASVAPGGGGLTNIKFSAGVASELRSDITFNNGNGVSFGLNAGTITASVQTNYQSPGAYLTTAQPPGAYITTAMASNQSSNFVQATAGFHGTNASGTIASGGISVSVAAPAAANVNISAGTLSNNVSAFTFSNGGGVSFGFDGSNITATVATNYQPPGAYLTTAMLSANSSLFAGTGFTTATTAGTNIVGTLNNSGLSMGIPAYLTTAAAGGGITNVAMSAGTVSTLASAFTFSNSNNVTFGLGTGANVGVITASFSAAGGGGAGTATSVATIAGTDLTLAVNTAGVTIGYPAWLTTAANSTVTGGGAMMSFFENSPLPATLNAIPLQLNATIASPNNALYFNPFILPQAVSASYIRLLASFNAQGTAFLIAGTNTTANTTFSAGFSSTFAVGFFTDMGGASTHSISCLTSASAYMFAQTSIQVGAIGSQYTISLNITWPQLGYSTNSQFTSGYTNANWVVSLGQLSNFISTKWLDIPFNKSLSPGNYWIAIGSSSNVSLQAGAPGAFTNPVGFLNWSIIGSNQVITNIVMLGNATNKSLPMQPGLGGWSTNTALSTTNIINLTDVTLMSNQGRNIFQLLNI